MSVSTLRLYAVLGLLGGAVAGAGCSVAQGATASGEQLYRACASCHGEAGAGDATFGAPRIAAMPRWYVASQLQRFKAGTRGRHFDDAEGLRMRAMAMQMGTQAEIDAVASYVASLPAGTSPAAVAGADPAVGQTKFAVCAACHGPKGEGNEALNAPPLAGMDDWYVARQLRKFQSGVRGAVKDDPIGAQMAGMALTVQPAEVDSVAAYVHALPR
ncbi:MAG: c-type cytochrome [Acidobacteria bacterium]|nr:c-type cytochrome [Acidobacteriota bacterium]